MRLCGSGELVKKALPAINTDILCKKGFIVFEVLLISGSASCSAWLVSGTALRSLCMPDTFSCESAKCSLIVPGSAIHRALLAVVMLVVDWDWASIPFPGSHPYLMPYDRCHMRYLSG